MSLHVARRASVRSTTYLITLADELAVVGLVHTAKIHINVDVLIIAPVQQEDHEIVLHVGLQICLHLLTALLSFDDGCGHVLVCVGTHLSGEFLVGTKL